MRQYISAIEIIKAFGEDNKIRKFKSSISYQMCMFNLSKIQERPLHEKYKKQTSCKGRSA